jgi:8-oxo-dGTP pyrophosphatase MutT (NUDIX family)
VSFADSYLGKLRQRVGSDLVLMPGAMVVVERPDGQILVTKRGDDGDWCLPAGAAEVDGSFAKTAIDELAEEVGLTVASEDLVPFGTLSDAAAHTIHYPNGDVTHCFAVLFLARRWTGEPRVDGDEAVEARFVEPSSLPSPMRASAATAVELYREYLASDRFQLA